MVGHIQNSLKPPRYWRRWNRVYYIIYALCFVLLVGAVVTFLFPDRLPLINVPRWLDDIIKREAIGAVISAVGVTAIVIAWLINITDQTVCGERIGVLINWAYPGFFFYYFTVFLMTVLCGAYVGGAADRRLPVSLAALGIVLGVALISRVSYVFLLSYEKRDRIAFTYHVAQLRKPKYPRLERMKRVPFVGEYVGRYLKYIEATPRDFLYVCRRVMMRIADIAGMREANCEDICSNEIWELWKTCIKEYREEEKNLPNAHSNSSAEEDRSTNLSRGCCRLTERFWRVLTQKSGIPCHQEVFLNDIISEAMPRSDGTAEEEICLDHLLAGFLIMLVHDNCADDSSLETSCQTLTDLLLEVQGEGKQCSLSFWKLFWGFALIMAIRSAFGETASFHVILELSNRLETQEFLRRAEMFEEAGMLDRETVIGEPKEFDGTENTEEPDASQLPEGSNRSVESVQSEKVKTFLTALRHVVLQEFGYDGGIYVGSQKVEYKKMIIDYLNNASLEVYLKDYNEDMAIVCWLLRKELKNGHQ